MDGNTLLIMSLIKLYREDWVNKKSTKRLKIISRKCKINSNNLYNTMNLLKSFNLSINKEIENLYIEYICKCAELDNIIFSREYYISETEPKIWTKRNKL